MNYTADPIALAYRAETRRLMAGRVPLAAGFFVLAWGAGATVEWWYHPDRAVPLLVVYGAYSLLCAIQIFLVYRRPELSQSVTEPVAMALPLGLGVYFGVVGSDTELLVLCLLLFVTGVGILYPWGLRGQLIPTIGTLVAYPLAVWLGAHPSLPIAYEIFPLTIAAIIASLGAYLLDVQRFSTHRHAHELREEQARSTALFEIGAALNAAISDERALADQLTAHVRRVLGADWAFLYQKDPEQVFRATSFSEVPLVIIEEMRTLDFGRESYPLLYRMLGESGTVDFVVGGTRLGWLDGLLPRWQVARLVLHAIKRGGEIIGVIGCSYLQPRAPLDRSKRQLLAAIAHHAVVALENARLMEEARQSDRLKSEFVATISHELRTPLSVILGYLDMLLDAALDSSRDDPLHRIRERSLELLELIQGMLDLNRMETRRLPIAVESFRVGDVIAHVRENLPESWVNDGVAVEWNVQGADTVLRSDQAKVATILRNLIHNALKFTETGRVTITAEPDLATHRIQFTVTDTGPGVPAAEHAVIFEMFRQGSGGTHRSGGVGLGLHIVKRFAEALGGQVRLGGEGDDGACFIVSLPMEVLHSSDRA